MKTRTLKIEKLYIDRAHDREAVAASLRLKGFWLTELGFKPGWKVEVITAEGLLVIRKRIR